MFLDRQPRGVRQIIGLASWGKRVESQPKVTQIAEPLSREGFGTPINPIAPAKSTAAPPPARASCGHDRVALLLLPRSNLPRPIRPRRA